ncbi:hypothetical protein ACFW2D_34695 [Streptomyces sp. NPDC058914]|uniref:hypothetical protein n=1 Tax=Streptomyces sp. NPDC058914 TaxID=3346671 RepID=UPI00367957CF
MRRLWFPVPASGLAAVWLALYERSPAAVPSPQFYVLCDMPGSLKAVSAGSVVCVVAAAAVAVAGAVRAVRKPSRWPRRPVLHLVAALALVVGADALDHVGSGIAYRAAVDDGSGDRGACESAYHVTPGWFFFLTPEDRDQWSTDTASPTDSTSPTETTSPTDSLPGRTTVK